MFRRKRRWPFAGFLGLVAAAIVALSAPPASAGPSLVFDAQSGEVFHAYQPFAQWYPASLTKMMTAYVAFRAIRQGRASLDTPVTMSQLAAAQPPSRMGFPVGTTISLDYALRIIIVRSANDVSVAIGEAVSGSLDAFIAEMNGAAARLGMTDTRFVNPHGLPDSRQVSTARDLALLTRALITEYPEYRFVFASRAIEVGSQTLTNHNRLLGRLEGADGMKTGYTCSSGFNLAASATRGGRRIVAIVLGGPTSNRRNEVAARLLEAGFQKSSGFRLFSRGPRLTELARPATVAEPVDLRPYVCQGQTLPDHLASFGTLGEIGASGGVAAASASAASGPPVVEMPDEVSEVTTPAPARGMTAQRIPLPRPRPKFEAAEARELPVQAGTSSRREDASSLPAPAFLRTPSR